MSRGTQRGKQKGNAKLQKTQELKTERRENKPHRGVREEVAEGSRELLSPRLRVVLLISFLALAIFTAICVFSPSAAGIVGEAIAKGLGLFLGMGRFAIPFFFLAAAVLSLASKTFPKRGLLFGGAALVFVCALALAHSNLEPNVMFESARLSGGGGLVGAALSWPLVKLTGLVGTYIFLICGILIGLVIAFEEQFVLLYRKFTKKTPSNEEEQKVTSEPEEGLQARPPVSPAPSSSKFYPSKPTAGNGLGGGEVKQSHVTFSKGYKLPPISILNRTKSKAFSKQTNEERKKAIEGTLKGLGVDARVVEISKGPTVSLFELEVGVGEKVRSVIELEQDIAYALGSPDIRIYSPIPGKKAIGIEVPNYVRDTVLLGDIIESLGPVAPYNQLAMAVGKDMAGQPVILDLAQLPHLLLAGSTGAGKSCCINSLISSLLLRNAPDDLRLIMIDPKYVEFNWYRGLPHLLCEVINEPEPASQALAWAVGEMNRRYQVLQESKVVHIDDYNALAEKDEKLEKMPKVVIVIDELGDLMHVAKREVETSISRLTAKARAVGIHMIIATQRPSVDVITGVIKNNITARIAFQVTSHADSRTIIGRKGAEKLLGRGDMLLDPGNIPQPVRVQGALVQQEEIELLTGFIKEQNRTQTLQIDLDEVQAELPHDVFARDPLLAEAAEFVVNAGEASASMLQTHLRVGYARARRLIIELQDLGIVGPHEGSKSRKVLVSPDELHLWKL